MAASKNIENSVPSDLQSIDPALNVGAGLKNLSNTCFLNAVLQCITHCVTLVQKIHSSDHAFPCPVHLEGFCCLCALREQIYQSLSMRGRSISPYTLANNLSNISSSLQYGQQEDAHEFLHCLLDKLHTCCIKDKSSLEGDSIVNQVFGGQIKSQLRCCECGHHSDTFEAMLDICLEIDDVESITDALQSFTKAEIIEDFKLTCDGCKTQVTMEKQMKLERAPHVITLQLKRFKNDGCSIHKITNFVEYPLELDLKPFLSRPEDEEETKYDLYAVLVHHGDSNFGHYFCNVRSSQFTWFEMDDSMVSIVSESDVLNQMAYLLFYTKQGSSPWFSSFLESVQIPEMIHLPRNSPISVFDLTSATPNSSLVGEPTSTSNSSSSSRGTPERYDIHTRPQSTPGLIIRAPSPSNGACKSTGDRSKARTSDDDLISKSTGDRSKARTSDDDLIGKYFDETLEEEKENHFVVRSSKPAAIKDQPVSGSVGRLLRGMPSSRRAGLLSCLPSPQYSKPAYGNKRNRPWELNDYTHQKPLAATPESARSTSTKSISPRSLRRSLFLVK